MTTEESEFSADLQVEIDRIQKLIRTPGNRQFRAGRETRNTRVKPRNAATLILVDRTKRPFRILMGKRHPSLRFMPGALVFPGGSVDRADGSIIAETPLPDATQRLILSNMRGRPSDRAANALGIAAVREFAEETGLLIGVSGQLKQPGDCWNDFRKAGVRPSLGGLRLLSRAITPPGPPRRFDTWFFIADSSVVAHVPSKGFDPSGELEALQWITPREAIAGHTREITRVMLVELMNRLETDPDMDPSRPIPHYFAVRERFTKKILHP